MRTSIIALVLVLSACGNYSNPPDGTVKAVWVSPTTLTMVNFEAANLQTTGIEVRVNYDRCSCNAVMVGDKTSGSYTTSNCGSTTITCTTYNGTGTYATSGSNLILSGPLAGTYK